MKGTFSGLRCDADSVDVHFLSVELLHPANLTFSRQCSIVEPQYLYIDEELPLRIHSRPRSFAYRPELLPFSARVFPIGPTVEYPEPDAADGTVYGVETGFCLEKDVGRGKWVDRRSPKEMMK
jgi:hypothetical protein